MDKDQKKDAPKENSSLQQNQNQDRRDQKNKKQTQKLTKEDLPDSTNESRGNMGSGQRQDSN